MRDESLFYLYSPISRIKGIGGTTATALQRLLPAATALSSSTLPTVRDLLFHLPVGLVDRRFTCPLREAPDGVVGTFIVTVDEHQPPPPARRYGGKKPYKVICSNETGDITLVFFHASTDYITGALPVGSRRVISGKVEHFEYRLQMPHPDIIAPVEKLAEVQQSEAVYPLTVGLTSRRIAKFVEMGMEKLPAFPEWINQQNPPPLKEIMPWKIALQQAHHPQTQEALEPTDPARLRLAYDEILAMQLHLAMLRRNMQQQSGEVIRGDGTLTNALLASLPFQLTAGQQKILQEIGGDLASGYRMGRLLQGDVGSGKTVVALLAMLRAVEQGLQTALMVPTEIIAQQHYETLGKLTAALGVKMVLLTGSVKGRARELALADIATGAAQIIVGTHALFQDKVNFKNLALVVIDEQHRFGVGQRGLLTAKGNAPHVLHMTATPIPRSLAMTIYGDMDCSSLREKPAERLPITTRLIPLSRYKEMMERLKAALDKGEKAYWICPLIEESGIRIQDSGSKDNSSLNPESRILNPDEDIAAAMTRFTEFKARFGDVVGLVHGRMKADERDEEMRKFATGKTKLLVATTVVEVGVDVRDATIMVVEKAERFGLSQLHQLRGRVGRGDKQSACVLLFSDRIQDSGFGIQEGRKNETTSLNPESRILNPALSRLSILRETEDGFRIAEADLGIRGGGDLLGTRQSGLPRFIFTDIIHHMELIEHAREDAAQFLKSDPTLQSERGKALTLLLQLFGYESTTAA